MRKLAWVGLAAVAMVVGGAGLGDRGGEGMVEPVDSGLFVGSGHDVRSFVREAEIAAPAGRVYRAWSSAEGWLEVYGERPETRANIELAIGGRYEWLFDGKIGSNGCQVLSYIPDRMLSFSWNAPPTQPRSREKRTWVVVEFEPLDGERTRVRLTHLGFGEGEHWDETMAYFERAWGSVLAGMRASLER